MGTLLEGEHPFLLEKIYFLIISLTAFDKLTTMKKKKKIAKQSSIYS